MRCLGKKGSKNRRKKKDTNAYCEYHREGKKYARQSRGGKDGRRGEEREKANDGEEREIKNPRFSSKDDDAQVRTV
jgi:hypothetical protein